ncbi:MAG: SDR family oxidoreductase, partial [Hyphomicrobiales bacterium]|nr:SDR family oxidoreductase [Hyphomicrobiales bacterium]
DFDRTMAVNARGVFLGLKYQLPVMVAQRAGVIVNIASAAGLVGAPMMAAYAASKHAVIGLTRTAADECARTGVRINALCPAFADTPMLAEVTNGMGGDRGDVEQRLTTRIPMRRVAKPGEIIAALMFLASDENSFMTGQAIAVDGGLTAV